MKTPLHIVFTNQFKRDYKKALKQNKNMEKLDDIIEGIASHKKLEAKHKQHILKGEYDGFQECHITPDWLLIWQIEGDSVYLTRLGSHSELFK